MNRRRNWLVTCLAALVIGGDSMSVDAQEIGFVEEFALAADRTVPLEQLIPGTQDNAQVQSPRFVQAPDCEPNLRAGVQRRDVLRQVG